MPLVWSRDCRPTDVSVHQPFRKKNGGIPHPAPLGRWSGRRDAAESPQLLLAQHVLLHRGAQTAVDEQLAAPFFHRLDQILIRPRLQVGIVLLSGAVDPGMVDLREKTWLHLHEFLRHLHPKALNETCGDQPRPGFHGRSEAQESAPAADLGRVKAARFRDDQSRPIRCRNRRLHPNAARAPNTGAGPGTGRRTAA